MEANSGNVFADIKHAGRGNLKVRQWRLILFRHAMELQGA